MISFQPFVSFFNALLGFPASIDTSSLQKVSDLTFASEIPIISECQKSQSALKFLDVETHLTPVLRSSIFSNRSQMKISYLQK